MPSPFAFIEGHSRFFSITFIFCGFGLLIAVAMFPAAGKVAIVESTLGILAILIGVRSFGEKDAKPRAVLSRLSPLIPLGIAVTVDLLAPFYPRIISAIALAVALSLILPLSRTSPHSRKYFLCLLVFVAGSIAYNVYYYYPINIGIDSWGYLAVSSAIMKTGRFSDIIQPTSPYYSPFPVMSIAPAMLSSISGLGIVLSLLVFPGSLILMQPLLVFLLSRRIFSNAVAASISAFIVVTESAVTQWFNYPIAESTAISLFLLLLLLLISKPTSRTKILVTLVIFTILVALHGGVALVAIAFIVYLRLRRTELNMKNILPFLVIFLGYQVISATLDIVVFGLNDIGRTILQFFLAPSIPRIQTLGGTLGGILFIWYGFAPALGLFSILIQHKERANIWIFAGLGLLGISFIANLVVPNLDLDRYLGLPAWLILAVSCGYTLRGLIRSSRHLLVLLPLILLVSFSAVVYPLLSPQFGYGPPSLLPTSAADRAGLQVSNTYAAENARITADPYSAQYLAFAGYQSSTLTSLTRQGDYSIYAMPFKYSGIIYMVPFSSYATELRPEHGSYVFLRWSDTTTTQETFPCRGVASYVANDTVNIVYNNSCDILATLM